MSARQRLARIALAAVLAIAGLWVARPFLPALFWAVVLAVAIDPLYTRAERRWPGGKSIALPLLFTIAAALAVLTPIALGLVQAAREAHALSEWLAATRAHGIPVPLWVSMATGLREPHFLSVANAQNLARQLAPLQIVVIGQLFALLSGGLDLSVASVMACSGVVGILALPHAGLAGALMIMILTGLLFGLANGAIIVGFSVSPFIVTLGMLSVAKGVSLLLTGGLPLYTVPEPLVDSSWLWHGLRRTDIEPRGICGNAGRRFCFAQDDLRPPCLRNRLERGGGAQFRRTSRRRPGRGLCYQWRGIRPRCHCHDRLGKRSTAACWEGLELQSIAAAVVGGVALAGGSGTCCRPFTACWCSDRFRMRSTWRVCPPFFRFWSSGSSSCSRSSSTGYARGRRRHETNASITNEVLY